MIVKKYRATVSSLKNPVSGIYTLEFRSSDGPFRYAPGQFLHLALDSEYDGTGQWPESRCFSMQSNPDESDLKITYAVKGRFTRMMEMQLEVGSEVWLKLPYGDLFTRDHNRKNTVFIAGGTGITPFLSLFTCFAFNQYINPKIYIGFRTQELNIYENELNQISNSNSYLKITYDNREGVIDIEQIYEDNGFFSSYFISGPPTMIKKFKLELISRGVPPDNVLSDNWE